MKDLVIGCMTNYNFQHIAPWVNSLETCGFTGTKAMVVYNVGYDVVAELERRGFSIIAFHKDDFNRRFVYEDNFNIVVTRFFHLFHFLNGFDPKEYRYVISTDVKDVVFQTNPSEWLEKNIGDKKIVVASESIRYKDEDWGSNNMRESFGPYFQGMMADKTVYNAGTLAGDISVMKDLFLNIFQWSNAAGRHYIPGGGGPDQAALNVLLTLKPYCDITKFTSSEEGWACQAGTTVDPKKIDAFRPKLLEPEPSFDGEYAYTNSGLKYCLVHQYDRVPEWKQSVERKYA